MTKKILITASVIGLISGLFFKPLINTEAEIGKTYWDIQSVDTMKFSRDQARSGVNDPDFLTTIDDQVKKIADLGANYIAIATPYDSEFIPFLKLWVTSARNHGIRVWFRGNFSGWEGWFDYPKISRREHLQKLGSFITGNPDLFANGDIFTPCPECENGGPGNPESIGDVDGHRNFLISEKEISDKAFKEIGKDVRSGYFSMNGDVAKHVMNKKTTEKLDGIVVVDHYVKTPEQLEADIENIADLSGGKIILGEIGVPIPDLHGNMTEKDQDSWLDQALSLISQNQNVIGLNYWVSDGGTTQIWNGQSKRSAAVTLSKYFLPAVLSGTVTDRFGIPFEGVKIDYGIKNTESDKNGSFEIYSIPSTKIITFRKDGYPDVSLDVSKGVSIKRVIMEKTVESVLETIKRIITTLIQSLKTSF